MEAQQQKAARATGESAAPQGTRQHEKADGTRLFDIACMFQDLMKACGTSHKEGRKTHRSLNLYGINFDSFGCIEKQFPKTCKDASVRFSAGEPIPAIPYKGHGKIIIHTTRGTITLEALVSEDTLKDLKKYAKLF